MDINDSKAMSEYLKPAPRLSREEALDVADNEFSLLMRVYYATEEGMVRCVTCGELMEWRGTGIAHWGHYVERRYLWTRWDVNNGGVQCESCNCFGGGMRAQMRAALVARHGIEEVERIEREKVLLLKLSIEELLELSQTFRAKRLEIQKEKCL